MAEVSAKKKRRPARLVAGDLCPTDGCGLRLSSSSPSGAYLRCRNDHVHAVRRTCQRTGCRRLATSFQVTREGRRYAYCADHDPWPFLL